jgi:hypothetical protein
MLPPVTRASKEAANKEAALVAGLFYLREGYPLYV